MRYRLRTLWRKLFPKYRLILIGSKFHIVDRQKDVRTESITDVYTWSNFKEWKEAEFYCKRAVEAYNKYKD
jgi:hypothetical protein